MQYLSELWGQVSELFASMTPAARIVAGLLVAVVVVSLGFLFQVSPGQPDELLLGGQEFSATELDAMESAFAGEQLNGYERVGNRMRIPRGQRSLYVAALAKANALPANFNEILMKSLDNGGVFEPGKMRDNRMKFALQQKLAMVIRNMSGIEHATVQFDEHVVQQFPREVKKTAVVAVAPRGSSPLSDEVAASIVEFMAHALAGLKPEDVTVTDLKNHRSINGGSTSVAGGPRDDPYHRAKISYEKDWTAKIRSLLRKIEGIDVMVNAELEPVLQTRQQSVKVDPKAVVVAAETSSELESTTRATPAGPPGVVSNAANQGASLTPTAGGANRGEKEKKLETTRSTVSHDSVVSEKPGLVPQRVTVAVSIPNSYYLRLYRDQHPAAEGEEPATPTKQDLDDLENTVKSEIQNLVAPLLPQWRREQLEEGKSTFGDVTVYRMFEPEVAALPGPSLTEDGALWLSQHWTTLGMLLLGGLGLLTIRQAVLGGPTPPPAEDAAADSAEPLRVFRPEEEADDGDAATRRRFAGGMTLRDELAELVREDPDAAASILRGWIGEAK